VLHIDIKRELQEREKIEYAQEIWAKNQMNEEEESLRRKIALDRYKNQEFMVSSYGAQCPLHCLVARSTILMALS